MSKKIAFQGEPGAFSHAAAANVFPGEEFMGCVTFEETLNAVQSGKADFAVVPVENSLYGRITDIHHLLPESGLFIIGETYLRVEMNLLGVPGATLQDIKAVQSPVPPLHLRKRLPHHQCRRHCRFRPRNRAEGR